MKNKITILILALLGIVSVYYYNVETNVTNENIVGNKKSKAMSFSEKESIKSSSKDMQIKVLPEYQYMVDALKPLDKEILKVEWDLEYGCYKLDSNKCNSLYLTATSYQEALWMQRQGYPSQSNLELLEDPNNMIVIEKLANENKYTPAMALLAIKSLNDKKFHDASSMALKLASYSSKQNTFPHRLMGEALLAENNLPYGLLELKIASLLGDNESKYLFNRYTHQYPDIAIDATDHANLYMGRVFGVPYGQYPIDQRPNSGDGGG